MRQVLRKTGFFLSGLMMMGLVAAGLAQAGLLFEWSYKNSSFNVGPTDVITLEATLQVLAGSTDSLIGGNLFQISFFGHSDPLNILDPYVFSSSSIFSDFAGQTILPGESFMFTFGTLNPRSGVPVPVGDYVSLGASMVFKDASGSDVKFGGVGINPLDITVSNVGGNPIPEPSTMLLFGSGLAALVAWRHKRTRTS